MGQVRSKDLVHILQYGKSFQQTTSQFSPCMIFTLNHVQEKPLMR